MEALGAHLQYMLPPRNTLRIGFLKGLKAVGLDYGRSSVLADVWMVRMFICAGRCWCGLAMTGSPWISALMKIDSGL